MLCDRNIPPAVSGALRGIEICVFVLPCDVCVMYSSYSVYSDPIPNGWCGLSFNVVELFHPLHTLSMLIRRNC